MNEKREHVVTPSNGTALVVYCATCLRVIAEFPDNDAAMQTMAHANAYDHWQSYSQDHLVTVTDILNSRFEYIHHDKNFHESSHND